MSLPVLAAIDLGASAGRVVSGVVSGDDIELTEVHRFANLPVRVAGVLQWDALSLFLGVLDGLHSLESRYGPPVSIGIDSWAVDYGLIAADGQLIGNPIHYRHQWTTGVIDDVFKTVPADELYAITGIQQQPFNTLFQLLAHQRTSLFAAARVALLIPDLISYWLTGQMGTEITNASTTQLLNISTRRWATQLARRLDAPIDLFPPIRRPGDAAGSLLDHVVEDAGLAGPVPVVAVASHDTAAAVAAVPASTNAFAYISCGSWALVGIELDHAIITEESRKANFTNEIGVDGTIRFLRNVTGLWLLQESMRAWNRADIQVDLPDILGSSAQLAPLQFVIDVQDGLFAQPGDLPERMRTACRITGQREPESPAEIVRCILDSLALAFRRSVRDAAHLSGHQVELVHMVGGGAANQLLCQLTADACELPVIAGPVEAASWGNVLVQARGRGLVMDSLQACRDIVRRNVTLGKYQPDSDSGRWTRAESLLRDIEESRVSGTV